MVTAIAINGRPQIVCAEAVFVVKSADGRSFHLAEWNSPARNSDTAISSFEELSECGYLTRLEQSIEIRSPEVGFFVDAKLLSIGLKQPTGTSSAVENGLVYALNPDNVMEFRKSWANQLLQQCSQALAKLQLADADRLARYGLEVASERLPHQYYECAVSLAAAIELGHPGGTVERVWKFGGRVARPNSTLGAFTTDVRQRAKSVRERTGTKTLLGRLSNVESLRESQRPLWR